MQNKYELRYLSLFEDDLAEITDYIVHELKNPQAALKLLNHVETAILERRDCPLAFEPYRDKKKRKYPYYKIYVDNYVVYYVIIDHIMEIRRILYKRRNTGAILEEW